MIKKHVGRLRNTDRKVAVVFMQIPGKEDHALLVDTDSLSDQYHDAVMSVLESNEAQQTKNLGDVLGRRMAPDSQTDLMTALHHRGWLQSSPITNVMMYPMPNQPIPLIDIIRVLDEDKPKTFDGEHDLMEYEIPETNYMQDTSKLDSDESRLSVAHNFIRQAEDLEYEASRKREEAYRMAPELRPVQRKVTTREVDTKILDPTQVQEIMATVKEELEVKNEVLKTIKTRKTRNG